MIDNERGTNLMVTGTLAPFKQGGPLSSLLPQPLSLATTFVAITFKQARTHVNQSRSRHYKAVRLWGVGVRVIVRVRVRARARSWQAAKAVGVTGVGRDGGDGRRRARLTCYSKRYSHRSAPLPAATCSRLPADTDTRVAVLRHG